VSRVPRFKSGLPAIGITAFELGGGFSATSTARRSPTIVRLTALLKLMNQLTETVHRSLNWNQLYLCEHSKNIFFDHRFAVAVGALTKCATQAMQSGSSERVLWYHQLIE
jgi:hypothetical protein